MLLKKLKNLLLIFLLLENFLINIINAEEVNNNIDLNKQNFVQGEQQEKNNKTDQDLQNIENEEQDLAQKVEEDNNIYWMAGIIATVGGLILTVPIIILLKSNNGSNTYLNNGSNNYLDDEAFNKIATKYDEIKNKDELELLYQDFLKSDVFVKRSLEELKEMRRKRAQYLNHKNSNELKEIDNKLDNIIGKIQNSIKKFEPVATSISDYNILRKKISTLDKNSEKYKTLYKEIDNAFHVKDNFATYTFFHI